MTAQEFFKTLIGLTIEEACKKLGYWWRLDYCHVNSIYGWYHFERAAGGRVELHTEFKEGCNRVVSENHNYMAEIYQKRDL